VRQNDPPLVDSLRDRSRSGVERVRGRIAAGILERVAGEDGPGRRERLSIDDAPPWFDPSRPIRRVHGDTAMLVGGIRALLLQSLHPLAMAGVAAHSGFRGDPWGRLQRTSYFLAATTFGTEADAAAAIARVQQVHQRVRGTSADGRPYSAADPHLLKWVHLAEVDSFLRAYQRYGGAALSPAECDDYLVDTARVAVALGVEDPALTTAELSRQLASYRPELTSTPEARSAARFMLLGPPLPLSVRGSYAALAAAAVGLLPIWARWPLRVPYLPITEATLVRTSGRCIVSVARWALAPRDAA
jgi:uncharacterized protein (DUF2236 family)